MTENKLKVGIVGVGGRGSSIHRNVLNSERLSLECICDVNRQAIDQAFQRSPSTVCDTYEQMLGMDLDAVLLVLPNFLHEEFTVQAAEAGKHVFVEKPIANRLDEAARMIKACQAHNVLLAVGHSDRYRSSRRVIKQLIDNGDLGDICGFHACTTHDSAKTSNKAWKTDPNLAPCVPLMQLGVHLFETLGSYFGKIVAVRSHHSTVSKQFDMIDSTHSLIQFENGLSGSVASYYMSPQSKVFNVYGTGGRALCQGDTVDLKREGGGLESFDVSQDNEGDLMMLDAFAEALLEGSKFSTEGIGGARALAVVWAAIYSDELGREVTVKETILHYGADTLLDPSPSNAV